VPVKDRQRRLEQRQRHRRKYALRERYGLSLVQYHEMVVAQIGRCAICGVDFNHTPNVDHDHCTGEVRGLLCRFCNPALERLEADSEWGTKALRYLERRAA